MDYALIENGVVTNLIWLLPENADDFPGAVHYENVPVEIGDNYDGEYFYRNGERVVSVAEIAAQEMEDMRNALNLLGVNVDEQMD